MKTGKFGTVVAVLSVSALAVTGCATGQIGDSGGNGTNPANKKLGLITGMRGEPFYVSLRCAAADEARKAGYELNAQAPKQFDAAEQTQILSGMTATKPGAILISPNDDTAMANPLKQATNNGIKVIEVDTSLVDRSIASSTLSSNNVEGGRKAARTLAKLVGDRQGSVLALNTKAGTSTTDARAKGFEEEIAKHPNLKLLRTQYTKNEPATAAQIVSSTMAAHPDLVGVFATNLNTGEGAGTALANAGKSGDVQLVEFDASPKQVEDLRNGRVQALIAQDPGQIGREGVRRAIAAITGKQVVRETKTNLISITKDNMGQHKRYFYKSEC